MWYIKKHMYVRICCDTYKIEIQSFIFKQEVSSRKIIVEANRALLSFKKDSGIVKVSKWPDDGAVLTQEGPKCYKNWTETTNKWDQNDFSRVLRVRNCLFRKIVIPLELGMKLYDEIYQYVFGKKKKNKKKTHTHHFFCIIAGWKCKM